MKVACGSPFGPSKCLLFIFFISSLLLLCPLQLYAHRLLIRGRPLNPYEPTVASEAASSSGISTAAATGDALQRGSQQQQEQRQVNSPVSPHIKGSIPAERPSDLGLRADERGSRDSSPHLDADAAAASQAAAGGSNHHFLSQMISLSPLGIDGSALLHPKGPGKANHAYTLPTGDPSSHARGASAHAGVPFSEPADESAQLAGNEERLQEKIQLESGSGGSRGVLGRKHQNELGVRADSQEARATGKQRRGRLLDPTYAVSPQVAGDDFKKRLKQGKEGASNSVRGTGSGAGSDPVGGTLKVLDPDDVPTVAEQLEASGGSTDAAGTEVVGLTASGRPTSVMKPPLDFTQYASFRVDDLGLAGFAGVDLSQETGAFAVSVGCGYFNDPKGLPGLAHALEHAVFLGSAQQPELKGWDEFISSRGGIHNAHTKPHITTFYVSAPSRHLPELFNVFLDHLFSPLLLPEQLEAELMAVQSEHDKNTPDLERVALHLALQYLQDSGTEEVAAGGRSQAENREDSQVPPISAKFGTGNLETLCSRPKREGIDVLGSMRRFHSKCYVPVNMAVSFRMGRIEGDISQQQQDQYGLWEVIELVSAAVRGRAPLLARSSTVNSQTSLLQHQRVSQETREVHQEIPAEAGEAAPHKSGKTSREGDGPPTAGHFSKGFKGRGGGGRQPEGVMLRLVRSHGWRRRLFIFWSAPANLETQLVELQCQPSSLLQYLLEHPLKGGLLQTLKEKEYLSKGEAFTDMTSRSSILGLVMDLTEKGESNLTELLGSVHAFVEKMAEALTDDTFVEQYFEAYKHLNSLLWRASDPLGPLDQVVVAAEATLQFPSRPDLVLASGFCLSPPPKEALLTHVRRLWLAMASGKHVVVHVDVDGKDEALGALKELPEYGVKYSVSKSPWTQRAPVDKTQEGALQGPHLIVPKPLACNVTEGPLVQHPIPAVCAATGARLPQLASHKEPEDTGRQQNLRRMTAAPPCVLLSDESTSVLWHSGEPFNKPIVRFFVRARVSSTSSTALYDALGKIFTLILAEKAKLHLAHLHGCGVDLVVAYTGGSLVFELQSLSSLFEEVAEGLGLIFKKTVAEVTEEEFKRTAAQLVEETRDFSGSTAYELALDVALSIVRFGRFSQFDMQEQLRSPALSFKNFQDFVSGAMLRTAVDCLLMGDISPSQAEFAALKFVEQIRHEPLPYTQAASSKSLNLQRDVEVSLRNPIPGDVNSAFVALYVADPPDVLESVLYSTVGDMLRAPFFDTLRTVNMDGYVAAAAVTELPPVVALSTVVQSSVRTPDELEEHVCSFLYGMSNGLTSALSPAEFRRRILWEGRGRLAREQATFDDFFSGVVSQVSTRAFCFIKSELAAVASQHFVQCPESLRKYFKKLVLGPSRQRVTVKIEAASPRTSSPVGKSTCTFGGTSPVAGTLEGPRGPQSPIAEGPLEKPGKQRKGPLTESLQPQGPTTGRSGDARNSLEAADSSSSTIPFHSLENSDEGLGIARAGGETGDSPSSEPERREDSRIVTVGLSADADILSAAVRRSQVEKEHALQECIGGDSNPSRGIVRLTQFAERPEEERERLLLALSEKLDAGEDDPSGDNPSEAGPVPLWAEFSFAKHCTIREETIKTTSTCEATAKSFADRIPEEGAPWGQVNPALSDTDTQVAPRDGEALVSSSAATRPPAAVPYAPPHVAASPDVGVPPESRSAVVSTGAVTPGAPIVHAAEGQRIQDGTPKHLQAQIVEQQQQLLLLHLLHQQQEAGQQQTAWRPRQINGSNFAAPQQLREMPLGDVQQQHEQVQENQQQKRQQVQQQIQEELATAEYQLNALRAACFLLQQQQQQKFVQPRVAILRKYGPLPAVVFRNASMAALQPLVQPRTPPLLERTAVLPGKGAQAPWRLAFPIHQQLQSLDMQRGAIERQIAYLRSLLLLQNGVATAAARTTETTTQL